MQQRIIRLTESDIRRMIRESVQNLLNEGPGAGYTVEFSGLRLKNIQIIEDEGIDDHGRHFVRFSADIVPAEVDWEAHGYDWGTNNENDMCDNMVEGGTVEGCVDMSDICQNGECPLEDVENELDCAFSVSDMVGRGWLHTDMPTENFTMTGVEAETIYSTQVFFDTITIKAPTIFACINDAYETRYDD